MAAEIGNKYAEGHGRPPIHTDPEEVQRLIDDYFEYIKGEKEEKEIEVPVIEKDDKGKPVVAGYKNEIIEVWLRHPEPPTVTGLTLNLGFANKSSLYDYSEKESFSNSIKRALTRIEQFHEIKASQGDKCTGNIFVLKNFGWKDNKDITTNGESIQPPVLLSIDPLSTYEEDDKDDDGITEDNQS